MRTKNLSKVVPPKSYLSKNLLYLRDAIKLTNNEFGTMLKIKTDKIGDFENSNYNLNIRKDQRELIQIGNFFDVTLDNLVYSDIESEELISDAFFISLRNELRTNEPCNRIKVNTAFEGDVEDIDDPFKKILWLLHSLNSLKQQCDSYKEKG